MSEALELRQTHRYVGSYKHLDMHKYVGTFVRVSRRAKCTDPSDCCEPTAIEEIVKVKAEPGVPFSEIKDALRHTFSAWGCAHEGDCCGCWSSSVSDVRKLLDGKFRVIVHASRNY
jgi:hypothetical protein